jgi:hypothetical protein
MKKSKIFSLLFLIFILVSCNNSISNKNKNTIINKEHKNGELTDDTIYNYLRQTLFTNKNYNNIIDSFYLYGMDSKNIYVFYHYVLLGKQNKVIEEKYFPVVIKVTGNKKITAQISPKNGENTKYFLRKNFPESLRDDAENIKDELIFTHSQIHK